MAPEDNSGDNFVDNKAGCEPALLFLRTAGMIVNLSVFFTQNPASLIPNPRHWR
ncbi:hypothetical protein HMPREF9080_01327 [Cardiobacterium valvarum F0432]|uniref:Uncharacterized protein n=1 Tax=Cardiobacterium valvarum F0432 TaxID=797473 RepID=G9ZEY7_9GAMM|nr:hypothetical protein HMPREF9080_01327 [Cardiobacterium valvarum F0432]